jgi:hypothetical protein
VSRMGLRASNSAPSPKSETGRPHLAVARQRC